MEPGTIDWIVRREGHCEDGLAQVTEQQPGVRRPMGRAWRNHAGAHSFMSTRDSQKHWRGGGIGSQGHQWSTAIKFVSLLFVTPSEQNSKNLSNPPMLLLSHDHPNNWSSHLLLLHSLF